jgi:hypothetical protein
MEVRDAACASEVKRTSTGPVELPSGIRDEIFLTATVTNLALSRNDSSDLMSGEVAWLLVSFESSNATTTNGRA